MDERRRELERQAKLGDVDAEARLLLERLRSSELSADQLRLAAYLGYEAASLAFSQPTAVELLSPDVLRWSQTNRRGWRDQTEFFSYVLGFSEWGKEAAVRVAIAAAHLLLGDAEMPEADGLRSYWCAHNWVVSPCAAHARLARKSAATYGGGLSPFKSAAENAARACWTSETGLRAAKLAAYAASKAAELGLDKIREGIRVDLVPWCLGWADPVHTRFERFGSLEALTAMVAASREGTPEPQASCSCPPQPDTPEGQAGAVTWRVFFAARRDCEHHS